MGPAALLDYDRSRLRGLVLEEGGPTSHIAIVARALGIPAVGEVSNATSLTEQGDAIIVDGAAGEVQIRPQPDVEAAYAEKARLRARRQEQYLKLRDVPSVSKDGVEVTLQLNAGLLVDLPHLAETGAAGVGLFRTELQFMIAERMPSASEQQALYSTVFAEAGDRPVTFRTLDIGGDKILPYMQSVEEENPALGWRAIRIGLDRPGLLRAQVRALLKAAAGRPLKIMFPMVATCDEFDRAKQIVEREKTHLATHNHPLPSDLKLGVMLEVPSLLFQLQEICASADFISLGTNDLMQFLFASDRENRRVADRFDPLSAPMLRALRWWPSTPVQPAARHGLRRDRRTAPRGHGPDRPRLPLALHVSGVHRPREGHAARDRRRRGRRADPRGAEIAGGGETLRPKLAHFAETHGIPV